MARALARGIGRRSTGACPIDRGSRCGGIGGRAVRERCSRCRTSRPPTPRSLAETDTVFLAVKPQSLREVCAGLQPLGDSSPLWVSVLAGVRLTTLCQSLGSPRVIRVMPNTPCLVRCGVSAYALGPGATAEDGQQVATLLGSVGLALELEEKLLDAVTGLSGSGPAYVFTIIEALSDGGVQRTPRGSRHSAGGTNGVRPGPDVAIDRRASRSAQGSCHQPRGDDDCRSAGPRTAGTAFGTDRCRRGSRARRSSELGHTC